MLYLVQDNTLNAWSGERINGVVYPINIEQLWSDAALEAIGLYRVQSADPVPEDTHKVGEAIELVNGRPKRVNQLEPVIITPAQVKAEAGRRILAMLPDWKQRNMNAQATALLQARILNGAWTAEEQAQADVLNAAWATVSAIRAASDALEATAPIPIDCSADKYWP